MRFFNNMRIFFLLSWAICLLIPNLPAQQPTSATIAWPDNLPVYDHIVIVLEENKNYEQVIDNKRTPYITKTLKAEGANFTRMYGEEHKSEGNYFWLMSGSNQGVGFLDAIPEKNKHPQYPFTAPNLFEQLIKKGLTCKGYSEDLPAIGDPVKESGRYARKHVPWASFANIPNGKTADTSCHLRLIDFPKEFAKAPTISFVIPNLMNDMHNGSSAQSVPAGDNWLKENLDAYYQWAKTHNSLLIITFDEDNNGGPGLTDPADAQARRQNRIPTVIAGAHIKPGNYEEGKGITHVNLLRTFEAMYKLERCGKQQENALKAGIADDYIITDIFEPITK
jgi:phosphatidylinositol-3-phosphatase